MDALVVILMGSDSDLDHARKAADVLEKLSVPHEMRIGSAHKTPRHVLELLETYEADPRPKVYITIAGRSNALSAFVDTQVTAPVIACPPLSSTFGGADIYSSLRMPSGVAPGVVIDPPGGALLAAKILAVAFPELKDSIKALQDDYASKVINADKELTEG
ncbi:MAG: AIR carboxylase family protein [Chloroflexi bacterium]|nr:AIR carboxylase family protein [Chloroflexota bacterium]